MSNTHFFIGDLYPNLFPATTQKQSIPEASEQKHYEAAGGKNVPVVMDSSSRLNVWLGIGAVMLLLFILST